MIEKVFGYIKENGGTGFIDKFFGIVPTQKDFERFEKFKEAIKLKLQMPQISYRKIGKIINIDPKVVSNWINLREVPFIVQMLKIYLELGDPKPNWKWLPINVGFGQTLDRPWVQVPMIIQEFNDVIDVINQLEPLPNSIEKIVKFFDTTDEERLRLEVFAYLLGFIVGDFGKKKNRGDCTRISSRNLSLKLTKKVHKNLLLGELIGNCVRFLGLRFKRYKDQVDKTTNAARFYWESQYSIFIEWIFRVCLGLKENETTTTSSIRMDWLFSAPIFFKKRFIQGIGDSDGSINFQSDCCYMYSYPNTEFLKKILAQLNVKSRIDNGPDGTFVSILPKEAVKIPIFFPDKNISYRFCDLKACTKANRIKAGGRTTQKLRRLIKKYSGQGSTKADTMKLLVHKHKIRVSYQTLSRYYSNA